MRVTRKNIDAGSFAGAIFVYDGLYNVVGALGAPQAGFAGWSWGWLLGMAVEGWLLGLAVGASYWGWSFRPLG